MRKNIIKYLNYLTKVKDNKIKHELSLTIKYRENQGIVVELSSNPDYADKSGLTNSGITFHYNSNYHKLENEQYVKWLNHLRNPKNAEKFLETAAKETGIFVCLSGTKIHALTKQCEEGRIVYKIK